MHAINLDNSTKHYPKHIPTISKKSIKAAQNRQSHSYLTQAELPFFNITEDKSVGLGTSTKRVSAIEKAFTDFKVPTGFKANQLTEICISSGGNRLDDMVMPMLGHLSSQCKNQWFTWITPSKVDKTKAKDYGFNLDTVRLLNPSSEKHAIWVFWQALKSGNSANVVVTLTDISPIDKAKLEYAAFLGMTQGIILTHK